VSQAAAEPRYSRTGRWLAERRLKIAIVIAVVEGIVVAFEEDFSRWTVIVIAAPVIAFYIFAGRALDSDTGRQVAWIAAASQAFAVLIVILAFVIGLLALIFVGIFALIALFLLFTDRHGRPSART
jgi:uncharacterized membrane protein YbhN (UPF0104 family)